MLCLTIVGFGDSVRGGRQLGELSGVVGVPDVGGVLVHAGAAFVHRNDAADSKPDSFELLFLQISRSNGDMYSVYRRR